MSWKAMMGMMSGLPGAKDRNDDDLADRLSYRYTVSVLLTFAILVTTKQYVGDKITCWAPAHFSGEWEGYTNSYCWIKNTYYLPLQEHIPHEHEHWKRDHLTYYQWVPLILLIQAMLYYMPVMVWRTFSGRSGIDIDSVVKTTLTFHDCEKSEPTEKHKQLKRLTTQMDRFLSARKLNKTHGFEFSFSYIFSRFLCPCCGRRKGNYLNALYVICKILFIINAVGQLFLMDFFLGGGFHMYGIQALNLWIRGGTDTPSGADVSESERFPRVTMCDFMVRRLGNLQRYTVQCVLPINLFHENVYLIIWFWMVLVAGYTIYSFVMWVMQIAFRIDRHRFVKKHLRPDIRKQLKKPGQESLKNWTAKEFSQDYLGVDGIFVLRLLLENTDDVALTEITTALWNNYKKENPPQNAYVAAGMTLDGVDGNANTPHLNTTPC